MKTTFMIIEVIKDGKKKYLVTSVKKLLNKESKQKNLSKYDSAIIWGTELFQEKHKDCKGFTVL